jgi:putative hydrolase of the HAD superfamily
MAIKAVGFDIDGTLYPHYRMFLYSLPSFLAHPLFVALFSRVRAELRESPQGGDFRAAQAAALAERLKADPEKTAQRIERYLYEAWEGPFRLVKPYPHVRDTLEALRAEGFRLGAVSDFPVGEKLKVLGVEDLFDCAFCSEDSGYLKPHPAPFLSLAERLGVRPDEVLYVGNSLSKDIEGAHGAGMRAAYLCGRLKKRMCARSLGSASPGMILFSDFVGLKKSILALTGAGERISKGGDF